MYDELGGFGLRCSPPGEPDITFEAEFCYRAWLHDHRVALTDVPVKLKTGQQSYILPGGTTLWGSEARVRNELANKQILLEVYADCLPAIQSAVRAANADLRPAQATSRPG